MMRTITLLMFITPTIVAAFVAVLAVTEVISLRLSEYEVAEVVFDVLARTMLAVLLLLKVRWSYHGAASYVTLFCLYALANASLRGFSTSDGLVLGVVLLINGITLGYLYKLASIPSSALAVRRAAILVAGTGIFLIVGSQWGVIVATFVVLVGLGAGLKSTGGR